MDTRKALYLSAFAAGFTLYLAAAGFAADQFIEPANISASASSVNYQLEAVYSCDGNGLTGDLHTNQISTGAEPPNPGEGTMWLAEGPAVDPAPWIRYQFDRVYVLNTMWVWNYNQITASGGDRTNRGINQCTIEYSTDGTSWSTLGTTHTLTKADGSASYAHNTEIDFGKVQAKFVRISAISNHGGSSAGLSEVRFYVGDTVGFETAQSGNPEAVSPAFLAVVMTSPSGQTVTVDYAATGGTATPGDDYVLEAGTLTFNPGETVKTIDVTVVDDGLGEEDETVVVDLSGLSGGSDIMLELGKTRHTYSIIDTRPSVQFDSASASGPEHVQIKHGPRPIPVSLSHSWTSTVSVDYSVVGGTAGVGDYSLVAGSLVFTPGQTTKNIGITVIDDTLQEGDETVVTALSNPTGAKLGPNAQHTYTITDDDPRDPPELDLNGDGEVDIHDFVIVVENWLACTLEICQ